MNKYEWNAYCVFKIMISVAVNRALYTHVFSTLNWIIVNLWVNFIWLQLINWFCAGGINPTSVGNWVCLTNIRQHIQDCVNISTWIVSCQAIHTLISQLSNSLCAFTLEFPTKLWINDSRLDSPIKHTHKIQPQMLNFEILSWKYNHHGLYSQKS